MIIKDDQIGQFIEICGLKISYGLFEQWGKHGMPLNQPFRIIKRDEDGLITVENMTVHDWELPDLASVANMMGEVAHNEWMKKHKEEKGWHHPSACPNHKPDQECLAYDEKFKVFLWCDKCHACMCSYAELPDSEKELDLKYPKLFFEILSQNYMLVKK